jgi:hypothetical protein
MSRRKYNLIEPLLLFPVSFWIMILVMCGCSKSPAPPEVFAGAFSVRDFRPLANWHRDTNDRENNSDSNLKGISLDFTNAVQTGFIIPTVRQVEGGEFIFEFSIKNTGKVPLVFFYKIYYQNETYKFPETESGDSLRQSIYAWENFYGSWEESGKTFAETPLIPADNEYHKISDRFRIIGNPRNEKRYFAGEINERWKRNPRVGKYSFMLVVTAKENVTGGKLPDYVMDITRMHNGSYINPWFYFLYGEGKNIDNTLVIESPCELKVVVRPDPGAGIYVNTLFFKAEKDGKYFCKTCGQDSSLYRNAAFEQFIHYIDPTTKFNNIPVIADVLNDTYTRMDYNWNKQFFRKDEMVAITASTTKYPCRTVSSNNSDHTITIKNPGTSYGKWEKQDIGVITRHGLTYGKWTVKAKLTELLNPEGLWNGLTNAIWLITQDQSEWNYRRDCSKEGYMANYYGGQKDKRVRNVGYSEIDFEILKTVPYCPSWLLPPAYNYGNPDQYHYAGWNIPFPDEVVADDGNIQVACTNWDMACWEPVDFNDGCNTIQHDGQTFWAHRWDKGYRAITEKTPEPDDMLFGSEYYYFQIDWRPEEIIWRVGPSKDKMHVVGYVNSTITSVPNNQMLLIISQEFHNTRWWIGSPYEQGNIPFPKNDIEGKIFEVTIE